MKRGRRPPKLTWEQAADIRAYLAAHEWRGARAAMCRKYGVSYQTVLLVANGLYVEHFPGARTGSKPRVR